MSGIRIDSSRRVFLLKLSFELLVIVVGILIALAIDGWNNNRKDRQLEQEYLQRLVGDLATNLEMAQGMRRFHENVVSNARAVYPLIDSGEQIDEVPLMTVVRAYWASAFWRPQWIDGTHQEMLSTGRYEIIRDSEIRKALLEYYGWTLIDDPMLEFASTSYRDLVRSEINAELQIDIRAKCSRFEESCDMNVDSQEIANLVEWLRGNIELSRAITRVILQSHRVDNEYLVGIMEETTLLKDMIEAELAAHSQ